MILKHICTLFILPVLLVVAPSIALAQETEEDDGDFEHVTKDRLVPFTGYLFTVEGVAKMIAKCDARIEKAVLEETTELKKQVIELDIEVKKKDKELEIKKEMYEGMLKIRQDRIDQLVLDARWNKFFIAGSFVAGIGITLGVLSAAIQVGK